MSVQALLSDLSAAGVRLYLEGDRLKFRAPVGVMTEDRRAKVRAHRNELIALLAVPLRREGQTPAEHFAELGGWEGVRDRLDPVHAHFLWDSARLWERDRDTPRAERWAAQYWATWAKVQKVVAISDGRITRAEE